MSYGLTLVKKNLPNGEHRKRSDYLQKKAEQQFAEKRPMRERHKCTIFKLFTIFLSAECGIRSSIESDLFKTVSKILTPFIFFFFQNGKNKILK